MQERHDLYYRGIHSLISSTMAPVTAELCPFKLVQVFLLISFHCDTRCNFLIAHCLMPTAFIFGFLMAFQSMSTFNKF